MMLQLGKGALQRAAAEHNVRSILFHLTPATAQRAFVQEPGVQNAIRALKQHGYRLGFIGDVVAASNDTTNVLSAFNEVHNDKKNGASLYESMSRKLNVPLSRTLLVTEPSLVNSGAENQEKCREMLPVVLPSQSDDKSLPLLSQFAKDLLNFDQCLDPTGRCFGPFRVLTSQVFYETTLSFALVNLKPIVQGHVLVVPKRPVARFEMLDTDEVSDLWTAAQCVGKQVESHYGASSLTFAIQDGKDAGQTVKHVHIHVIPRAVQDFECNDDVYTEIERHEQKLFVDNETRTAHSEAEMAAEATQLRHLFL